VTTVTAAVEALVRATVDLSDEDMGRPWVWREYDEEGLRFALLVSQHELRDLAVRLAALRAQPPTQAQRILGQYHHAYRDLTGALAGLRDDDLDRAPAPEEWSLREVIEHMVGADHGFLGVIQYSRAPERPRDEKAASDQWPAWRAAHGYRGPERLEGGIAEVRNTLFQIHRRILSELGDLTDAEIEDFADFWDGAKPIRFRLHRFEAHYVQHTVQVDKTLEAIGRGPTEARRLARVLYRDLAPVEMLASAKADALRDEVARTIADRASEIAARPASI
jgi:uncharacterized damage-inducible protein DinB